MMKQVAPGLIQAGGEVVKQFLLEELHKNMMASSSHQTVQAGQPGEERGCPFCAAAKHLAAAHLYLTRAVTSGHLSGLYLELVKRAVADASNQVSADSQDLDRQALDLIGRLHEIEVAMALPSGGSLAEIARKVLTACHIALDLAEQRNQPSVIDSAASEG